MPRKKTSPIVKVLLWRNPGPLGRDPRWDLEIVRQDGSRDRRVGVPQRNVGRILEEAGGAVPEP